MTVGLVEQLNDLIDDAGKVAGTGIAADVHELLKRGCLFSQVVKPAKSLKGLV